MTLQMDAPTAPPPGALLVRLPVTHPSDLHDLPRVPAPHRVTVSVSDPSVRPRVDATTLEASGYHLVGVHVPRAGGPPSEALLLVRAPLLDAQPTWARLLLERADRVFDCDLGPVQHVFAAQVAQHVAG